MKNKKFYVGILTVFCLAMMVVAIPIATHAQGRRSSPPSWAQGTFYGTAPDGSQITLTLDSNGEVTALINGNSNYGTYYRNSIQLNGAYSRVTRNGNGIRTTRNDNGEVINYTRNGWNNNNNGNDGGWNGNGNMSSPPSWAVGSFYSSNESYVRMTIASNGQVTFHNFGLTNYGTYNRGSINLNGETSTLTRNGNGIRIYNRNSGQTTDYLRVNSGGGNGGGGWNGSGNMSSPPSWAQGTFYGTAQDGSQITLSLESNGQVTALINGNSNYGTYYRNSIQLNGASSRITRYGNGIRTTRNDNGEVINYSRTVWNNNNGGGNGGRNGGVPVNWAVGSFAANNPENGGTIYLTVANDGQVTVDMGGGPVYGTLYGTTLTIAGATANVIRSGNGIRTVRTDNGQSITYRRQ